MGKSNARVRNWLMLVAVGLLIEASQVLFLGFFDFLRGLFYA